MQSQSQSSRQSHSTTYGQQGPVSSASLMRGGAGATPTTQPSTWTASASTNTQATTTASGPHGTWAHIAAPAAQPSTRRASPSTQPKKQPKKRTRPASRDEPPPKPTAPEFPLPDPTAPPPPHFLRNQENLLGRAGRIARVKPANLAPARGSTPLNPILVDDEDHAQPTLSRRAPSRERTQPYIDPALLTAPTNQEIVSVLIGQKDIFPILEGVLKLVMGSTPATRPKTGFEHKDQAGTSHAPKKRKLNRVPAGATDWDVPYPFEQGEGPEEYHQTWERERGKQLISQLIQLIKSAARKAATKKYLAQQKQNAAEDAARKEKHKKRPRLKDGSETATKTTHQGEVLQDTSNTPSPVRTLDQLMASLNNIPDQGPAQTPGQDAGTQTVFAPPNTSTTYDAGSTGSATPTPSPIDQPLFDTWMSFLESFPMNFDGATSAAAHTGASSDAAQARVGPAEGTTPGTGAGTPLGDFDFADMVGAEMADAGAQALGGALDGDGDFDAMWASMFGQQQQHGDGAVPPIDTGGPDPAPSTTFGDHLIDPDLLALSLQIQAQSSATSTAAASSVDSSRTSVDPVPRAMSPMASGGSSTFGGSTNPGTPVSAGWEMSMPDVFMGGGGTEGGVDEQGNVGGWNDVGGGDSGGAAMMDFGILPEDVEDAQALGGSYPASAKGKGKEIDAGDAPPSVSRSTAVSTPTPAPSSTTTPSLSSAPHHQLQLQSTSSTQLRHRYDALLSAKASSEPKTVSRQQRRDDIVKRAEEQKRAIQKELDAVKTRLWETTIEQAGLITLQKRLALKGEGVRGGAVS
ncbi:hypothetical protein BJ912DRAFT_1004155 [Pholiota molesta]|nr:hypothetical protein BJ912DRAFT_1004155 [Pholiota molesta]